MKTLKESLTTPNSGIFTAFINPVWAEAFPDTAELDIYFFTRFGDRIGNKLIKFYENDSGVVTGDSLIALSKMIYDINARKWEHLWGVYVAEYNPLNNTEYVETVVDKTETEGNIDSTGSGTNSGSGSVINKKWALGSNSSTGENDSASNTTTSNEASTSNSTDTDSVTDYRSERKKAGNIGVTSTIQLISEETDYWGKWSFIDQICKDICDIIALSIY